MKSLAGKKTEFARADPACKTAGHDLFPTEAEGSLMGAPEEAEFSGWLSDGGATGADTMGFLVVETTGAGERLLTTRLDGVCHGRREDPAPVVGADAALYAGALPR